MKTLALSACLAVACTASAAGLKDPAQVASDWNKVITDAREPVLSDGPLGLTVTPPVSPPASPPVTTTPMRRPRFKNDVLQVPPGWQIDPKMLHDAPNALPPPDAKPWYYRGQKFWIIPINTTGEK